MEQEELNEGGQADKRSRREDELKRLYEIRDEARERVLRLTKELDEAERQYLSARFAISSYHRARGARG